MDTTDRPPYCVAALLQTATRQLEGRCESARLDAEILLAWLMQQDRSYFRAFGERSVHADTAQHYLDLIRLRAEGQPIAYLTGFREFWSLAFEVSPDVLIPRPETETLVEQVLLACRTTPSPALLDLGTGSGAVAVSLATARPDAHVTASDTSLAALRLAFKNASRHHVDHRLRFVEGHWFDPLEKGHRYDCIASNPPYLGSADPHLAQGDLRFEPLKALVSGSDGLDAIRHIAKNACRHLKIGGVLALEHGLEQAIAVQALLRAQGFEGVHTVHDLGGRPRVTLGCNPHFSETH